MHYKKVEVTEPSFNGPFQVPNAIFLLTDPGAVWVPGTAFSDPAVHVIAGDANGNIVRIIYTDSGAGSWGTWQSIGGATLMAPAAVSWGPANIEVVV